MEYMSTAVAELHVPVMAHGLQNSIIELNWARDEQCGVVWLGRHPI
jgi:hypothetical protein